MWVYHARPNYGHPIGNTLCIHARVPHELFQNAINSLSLQQHQVQNAVGLYLNYFSLFFCHSITGPLSCRQL